MSSPSSVSESYIKSFKFDHTNSTLPYLSRYPHAHTVISFYREKSPYPFEKGAIQATVTCYVDGQTPSKKFHTILEDQILVQIPKAQAPLSIRYFTVKAQDETILSAQTRADYKFTTNTEDGSLSFIFLKHVPQY